MSPSPATVVAQSRKHRPNLVNSPVAIFCLCFQYGFAYGAASLASLIASPFGGTLGQKLGAKWVYAGCSLAFSVAGIAFGFVTFIDSVTGFLVVSYILRIVIGISDSLAWISVVSLLMALFPSRVASIMATTETIFGIGLALGMNKF